MSQKTRYLVGYRHSAVVPKALADWVDAHVASSDDIDLVRELETGQRVLAMTEERAQELATSRTDLLIEEDQELEFFMPMPGLSPRVPSADKRPVRVEVVDEKTREPVDDVTIYCMGTDVTYKGVTNEDGIATVSVFETHMQHVIASPRNTYWSRMISAVEVEKGSQVRFALGEIPVPGGCSWTHLLLGVDQVSQSFTGRDIKVAVIDSGIADHQDLRPSGGRNTLDGQDPTTWNVDEKGHGTHCAGTIAALRNRGGVTGVAPDAETYALKILPGGRLSDLIEAINWCVDHKIDVLNISLGSPSDSVQLEVALVEAAERGITSVAAAGNDRTAVAYPAAYDSVIAVSAIGKLGTFPPDSDHNRKIGDFFSTDGELFFANFSNFGHEIDVCAPGVAILSSVPTGYASWDGTSIACPHISGLVALILEAYPEIRTGDGRQPYYVRQILADSAIDIGLPVELQGLGLPNAALALADAQYRRHQEERAWASLQHYAEAMLDRTKTVAREIEQQLAELETM